MRFVRCFILAVCALALAHRGVRVVVCEAEPSLTHDLRAGSYHPPTLEMMAPYGITERMHEHGLKVRRWQIRSRRDGLVEVAVERHRPQAREGPEVMTCEMRGGQEEGGDGNQAHDLSQAWSETAVDRHHCARRESEDRKVQGVRPRDVHGNHEQQRPDAGAGPVEARDALGVDELLAQAQPGEEGRVSTGTRVGMDGWSCPGMW